MFGLTRGGTEGGTLTDAMFSLGVTTMKYIRHEHIRETAWAEWSGDKVKRHKTEVVWTWVEEGQGIYIGQ